ncbi:MAG TPA: 3-deoxy-7-phosphoheptulonate synthase [Polyangiaceae bacterium]|nr:3-deoxy-7-phosphoheptulonate synthase [Polyangiaceae bacterium]
MLQTKNLRILETTLLNSPDTITSEIPLTERSAELVTGARKEVEAIIHGRDRRLLVIVGPCSIHDPAAALDYAARLAPLRQRVSKELLIVMRVYFEKPRTTVGWKGLINDPHLDGTFDIPTGIRRARTLLRDLAEMGIPSATELLDPIIPQYIADLVTWTAIGARTTESQTHREMASGLSMSVGFKNGTDGSLAVAVNAMLTASRPHSFLGIDGSGRVGVVRTAGNPNTHLVLRGGHQGPNYAPDSVFRASVGLRQAGINPRVLIDASHDNSGKNHERQPDVLVDVGGQVRGGSEHVLGVMLESNLVAGRQELRSKADLVYGQSITDACVDFPTTERALLGLAEAAAGRRPLVA